MGALMRSLRVRLGLVQCIAHQFCRSQFLHTSSMESVELFSTCVLTQYEHTAIMMVIVILCGGLQMALSPRD